MKTTSRSIFSNPFLDVGCPSVCCDCVLQPLGNKEAALAYGRVEYSEAGNPNKEKREKKMELREMQASAG